MAYSNVGAADFENFATNHNSETESNKGPSTNGNEMSQLLEALTGMMRKIRKC